MVISRCAITRLALVTITPWIVKPQTWPATTSVAPTFRGAIPNASTRHPAIMALCVVPGVARSCLRLSDEQTSRGHRFSVAIDPTATWTIRTVATHKAVSVISCAVLGRLRAVSISSTNRRTLKCGLTPAGQALVSFCCAAWASACSVGRDGAKNVVPVCGVEKSSSRS